MYYMMVRETTSYIVQVNADSIEDAEEKVQEEYNENGVGGEKVCGSEETNVEFRACCSGCMSDFGYDDWDDLREVNNGTSHAMALCDRCVDDMEERGELLRCECCGDVFSPKCMKANPDNGEMEICPDCGEVWCKE